VVVAISRMEHRVTNRFREWLSRTLSTSVRGCCLACNSAPSNLPLCARCREDSAIRATFHEHRVPLDAGTMQVHALGLYWERSGSEPSPAARLLHRFKYTGERVAGRALARVLAVHAAAALDLSNVTLVPIPLHPRRLRSRGFNQAAWLARALAKSCRASVHPDALARPHDDAPRPGCSARERRTSTAPVFLDGRRAPRDRPLVLVDDVCTTGMTLAAAAAALTARGLIVEGAIVLLLADRARRDDTAVLNETWEIR
jgi:predicted amidophosphoribosyltransferase